MFFVRLFISYTIRIIYAGSIRSMTLLGFEMLFG